MNELFSRPGLALQVLYDCPVFVHNDEGNNHPSNLFFLKHSLDLLLSSNLLDRTIAAEVSGEDLNEQDKETSRARLARDIKDSLNILRYVIA